jgi:hypothetical protein
LFKKKLKQDKEEKKAATAEKKKSRKKSVTSRNNPPAKVVTTLLFGQPVSKVACQQIQGYAAPIPTVLLNMKQYLLTHNGLNTVGIFRLAPDQDERRVAMDQVDQGTFEQCDDVNTIATLIKVYVRELPDNLLMSMDSDDIENCETPQQAAGFMQRLNQPEQSLYYWLIDLCVEVSRHSEINKMTFKNLGVVFGPNLISPTRESDPHRQLAISQKVNSFFEKCCAHRAGAGVGP